MKAITLRQPWANAIVHGGKRIENRSWGPPRQGARLALHAGANFDADARDWIAEMTGLNPAAAPWLYDVDRNIPRGVIVATFEVLGVIHPLSADEDVATWKAAGLDVRWYMGPPSIGWVIGKVRVLSKYVAVRGSQGLWELGKDATALVTNLEVPHVHG